MVLCCLYSVNLASFPLLSVSSRPPLSTQPHSTQSKVAIPPSHCFSHTSTDCPARWEHPLQHTYSGPGTSHSTRAPAAHPTVPLVYAHLSAFEDSILFFNPQLLILLPRSSLLPSPLSRIVCSVVGLFDKWLVIVAASSSTATAATIQAIRSRSVTNCNALRSSN